MFKKALSLLLSVATLASCMAGTFSAFAADTASSDDVFTVTKDSTTVSDNIEYIHGVISYDDIADCAKASDFLGTEYAAKHIALTNNDVTVSTFDGTTLHTPPVMGSGSVENTNSSLNKNRVDLFYDNSFVTPDTTNDIAYFNDIVEYVKTAENGDKLYKAKENSYLDIVYDLGGNYSVEGLVLATPSGHKNFVISKYQIITYADAAAYNANNGTVIAKYEVGNSKNTEYSKQGYKITENSVKARYVKLRITELYTGEANPNYTATLRIGEFSVYGTKLGDDTTTLTLRGKAGETNGNVYATADSGTAAKFATKATNSATELAKAVCIENYEPIEGDNVTLTTEYYNPTDTSTKPITYPFGSFSVDKYYNGTLNETPEICMNVLYDNSNQKEDSYIDYTYDLGAVYDLSGMIIAQSDKQWTPGAYEVRVYETAKDYIDGNYKTIVDYELYKSARFTSYKNNITAGNQNHAYALSSIKARYVVLRITKFSLYDSTCTGQCNANFVAEVRLGEFSVAGTKAAATATSDKTLYLRADKSSSTGKADVFSDYSTITVTQSETGTETPLQLVGKDTYNPINFEQNEAGTKASISVRSFTGTTYSDNKITSAERMADWQKTVINNSFAAGKYTVTDSQGNTKTYNVECGCQTDIWDNNAEIDEFRSTIDSQGNENTGNKKPEAYIDVVYDLGAAYDLTDIVIAPFGDWSFGAYEILTGLTTYEYETDTLTKQVDYSIVDWAKSGTILKTSTKAQNHAYHFETPCKARYVVCRLTEPSLHFDGDSNYRGYARIGEFALFGTIDTEADTYYNKLNVKTSSDALFNGATYRNYFDLTRNLVANKLPVSEYFYNKDVTAFNNPTNVGVTAYGDSVKKMNPTTTETDFTKYKTTVEGKEVEKNYGTGMYHQTKTVNDTTYGNYFIKELNDKKATVYDNIYYQLNYKLDGKAQLTTLAMMMHGTYCLRISNFDIIVADSEDKLVYTDTAPEGVDVFHYGREDLVGSDDKISQIFMTELKKTDGTYPEGSYVALRINCAIDPEVNYGHGIKDSYVRLTRFGLLGTYVEPAGEITATVSAASYSGESSSLVTAGSETVAEGAVKDWNKNYAKGCVSKTFTANATKYTGSDDKPYVFKGWYDGEKQLSADASYTTTESVTAEYGLKTFKVTYLAKNGTTVMVRDNVSYGTKLGDLNNPTAPTIYGYNFSAWDKESTTEVTADTVVKATYTRDTNKKGNLNVKGSSDSTEYSFDQRITLTDKGGKKRDWRVNNAAFAYNTENITLYAFGSEMTVETSNATESAENAVSVLGADKSNPAQVAVFAHNVNVAHTKVGFVVVNATGKTELDLDKSKLSTLITAKKAQEVVVGSVNDDFMLTINIENVKEGAQRYVYAFVEDANGNRTYSEAYQIK